MSPIILAVDDEPSILELLRYNLVKAGFRVLTARTGREALAYLEASPVDLVVLDLMLPDITGLEVARQFRARSKAPILVLTARGDEVTRVRALQAGADDCMTKPFSPREFVARVRAQLRRWSWRSSGQPEGQTLEVGPLKLDLPGRRVFFKGEELHVTPMEFEILRVLCQAPGRVFPRDRLLALATGHEVSGTARNIDVHIRSLRLKLEDEPGKPKFLITVRGAGYCIGRDRQAPSEEGLA